MIGIWLVFLLNGQNCLISRHQCLLSFPQFLNASSKYDRLNSNFKRWQKAADSFLRSRLYSDDTLLNLFAQYSLASTANKYLVFNHGGAWSRTFSWRWEACLSKILRNCCWKISAALDAFNSSYRSDQLIFPISYWIWYSKHDIANIISILKTSS